MRNLIILLIVSLICCGCGKIENTKHDAIKIIKLTQSQEENAKIETKAITRIAVVVSILIKTNLLRSSLNIFYLHELVAQATRRLHLNIRTDFAH